MANLQERRDKTGKLISYSIRVHRGRGADGRQLKPWTVTFDVAPTWTEKTARKKAEAFAATFEKECREGVTSDSRQKFEPYCEYVIGLKEATGTKHTTICKYRYLTERIYPAIGHLPLKDIRLDHLNSFYLELSKLESGTKISRAVAKMDLSALLKKKGTTREKLASDNNLPISAVCHAVRGKK